MSMGLTLGTTLSGAQGAAAPATPFRPGTTGVMVPDGTNALSGQTKRRNLAILPIKLANGTARCKITLPGHYVNSSWVEATVAWTGVTAMAVEVHCRNSGGTVVGNLFRLKVAGADSWVPAAGDITLDAFSPSDLGLAAWPVGGIIRCMWETDAASGTVFPMSYVAGSSGDTGDNSWDGGTTSLGSTGFTQNGGVNGGTRLCKPIKADFEHTGPAIAFLGDSRPNGKGNQPAGYGLIRGGYAEQAAYKAGKPIMKLAIDGDRVAYWLASSTWRMGLISTVTDIYGDLGYNDISGYTAATVIANINSIITALRAANATARIHWVKIGLRTSSASGNWLAPPDQTVSSAFDGAGGYGSGGGTERTVVNAHLASLVGTTLASVVDLVPDYQYDTGANADVYFSTGANDYMTADGAHFTAAGEAIVGSATSILYNHMVANVV